MTDSKYRFVVHFQDGSSGTTGLSYTRTSIPAAELSPKSAQITFSLNRVGTMSLTVNKAEVADLFTKYPLVWKKTLTPVASTVWVLRNNQVIWAGNIWDIERSTDSQLVTLQCEEIIGLYDRMILSSDFAGNNASTAIGSLINSLLVVEGVEAAQMKIVDFSSVLAGTSYLPSYVPQWYEFQKLKIGELIRQLLALAGVDWHQAVGRYDSTSGEWYIGPGPPLFQTMQYGYGVYWGLYGFGPSATFNGAAGRDWETGGTNPIEVGTISGTGSTAAATPVYPWSQVAFEWGAGTRQSVDHFKINYSARSTANVVRVGGYGQQGLQLHQRYTMANNLRLYLPKLFGAWEDAQLTTQGMVDARTKQVISSTGLPSMYLTARVRQPSALASYDVIKLGDRVRCTIKDTGIDWTGKLRIYNITLQTDDRGNEWMSVDLAPDTTAYQ